MNQSEITDFYKFIGKSIKEIRKYKKIKTHELAEKINVADGTIRNIESGTPASLPLLISIANELEVPFDYLIRDYIIHTSKESSDSVALEIFSETYNNCSPNNKEILLSVIKAFGNRNNKED